MNYRHRCPAPRVYLVAGAALATAMVAAVTPTTVATTSPAVATTSPTATGTATRSLAVAASYAGATALKAAHATSITGRPLL